MNQREIKFRAWLKDHKGRGYMMSWLDLQTSDYTSQFLLFEDASFTFMEHTGQVDRNGKEIYEGDLLRVKSQYETEEPVDSAPNEVYFRDGAFRCGFHDMLLTNAVCTGNVGNWNVEVIGNVYENPDLIPKE